MAVRGWSDGRGSVTAETAVALPALAVLLVMCLWAVTVVGQQLRCIDAARIAARALARGETEPLARSAAREAAPEGAAISVQTVDGLAVVEVRLTAGWPGPWGSGGGGSMGVDIGSRAVAAMEDR